MPHRILPTSFKLFRNLSDAECHELRALIRLRTFGVGDLLVRQDERSDLVFFIEEGIVKVLRGQTKAVENEEAQCNSVVLSVLGSGTVIGELHALDGGPHSYSVKVVETVDALVLPVGDFRRCVREMPGFSEAVMLHLVRMIRFQSQRQEILSLHNVSGALAAQLLLFAEQCGEVQNDNSVLLPLPLDQTLLSHLTGHSREGINKFFNRFLQAGYLEKRPHYRILLKDINALKNIYQQAIPRR